jgi:selenocysteine-specific elongation factor
MNEAFISVGIAGHVDHGKTTLVRRLTGIDTDRLKEEKRRGLTIEPGIAPLILPSGFHVALVDVPGHSDFLKNTIRGLSCVDIAALVVAADDGIMPQTRDHLEILNYLKAKGGFIVLSKADMVDDETLAIAEIEIQDAVKGSFLESKPVIPFSSVDRRGLNHILQAIETEACKAECKPVQNSFRLWIDQVRSFPGFGTVASGTVLSGSIRQDEVVELLPSGKELKVRFIEVHHRRAAYAAAGQRVGLNLQNISLQEIRVGMSLATPKTVRPSSLLNARLSLLKAARRPVKNRERVKVFIGTYATTALLAIMQKELLNPGESELVQLRLPEPIAVSPRDCFIISPINQHCVIGGGQILETANVKFRAGKAEKILNYLQPLQKEDVSCLLSRYFSKFPDRPVSAQEIISNSGFSPESIRAAIESQVRVGELLNFGGRYYDKERYEGTKCELTDIVKRILLKDSFKCAAGCDEIRFRLNANLDDALFEKMLDELCGEGKLIRSDTGYCIPNCQTRHSSQREALIRKILEFAREQRYLSFHAGTFSRIYGEKYSEKEVIKVIDYLHAQKKLIRLHDGRFLSSEAIQDIKDKIIEQIQRKGNISIGDCREIFGYGRNRAIPVFDYLDHIGLTLHEGDVRVLANH